MVIIFKHLKYNRKATPKKERKYPKYPDKPLGIFLFMSFICIHISFVLNILLQHDF